MKICYITAQSPYGPGEQFIPPEILNINKKGHEVIVIPVKPENKLAQGEEAQLVGKQTIKIPLYNFQVFYKSLVEMVKHPVKAIKVLGNILTKSNGPKKIIKNLAVFPKGLVTAQLIQKNNVEHIHCHWASTSSTVGYIASTITGIPFSITAHRWDIADNNMLNEKVRKAKFIRAIDEPGKQEILELICKEYVDKCVKIHVGVDMPKFEGKSKEDRSSFNIITPANFVEKKGHIYLIEAINTLVQKGYDIRCNLYGGGPLEATFTEKVKELRLEKNIIFGGLLGHDQLLQKYADGEADCVVLPSIVTDSGEKEGIPVSLMEAMAAKIPVISTYTGGIPELLSDDCGVLIEQKDSKQLADAIESLIKDTELRKRLGENGYKRVYEEFYIVNVVEKLVNLFEN